jgi:hypothetical protein
VKPDDDKDGLQTNKINGENTRALHLKADGSTPYPLIGFSVGGTPNQKWEAATVRLRAGHVRGDRKMLTAAAVRLADLAAQQRRNGHQAIGRADEGVGDSHVPIWYRGSTSGRLTTAALRETSKELAELDDAMQGWWSDEFGVCEALIVPSGARAGSIVGPGARPKLGWNPVRDYVYQVAAGRQVTAKLGKSSLAGTAQDTFACFLAPQVAALPGGFGPKAQGPCRLHDTMIVHRFPTGHVANFPQGMEWQKNFCRQAWVSYETGEIGLDKGGPFFAGEPEVIIFEGAPR